MDWQGKMSKLKARFDGLSQDMADPAVMSDQSRYAKTAKAAAEIGEVVDKYDSWKKLQSELEETRTMLDDPDTGVAQLVHQEISGLEERCNKLEEKIKQLLLPKDPNDEKGVVLEIRAGTGGDEATLFAAELYRMYGRYAEDQGWKAEMISSSPSEVGGLKEVISLISGRHVYSKLKYEAGVHRVQRVPKTETQGRIHTSAVTVAVMPQVDDVEIEVEAKDIRVDTYCSSGPGGQSVNTTYSAVRITHLPTNLVVTCQDEKSQIKNKSRAMQVLRSRLYEIEMEKQHAEQAESRRGMVRTGDRSEKIRTYNFPQGRVTDHRVQGLTLHQLEAIMTGALNPLIEALSTHFQAELMKQDLSAV